MVLYRCQNCKWFDHQHARLQEVADDNLGYCRKHRPVIYLYDNRHYGGWPLVDINDLCGEFRQDEETQ